MAMTPPTTSESKAERGEARTKIVVINMVDAVERRDRFEKRARHAPLPWSFYPAHTSLHAALTYDEQGAIIAKGRPLRAGELGVYSSHYAAWQDLQSDDVDQYVVLEAVKEAGMRSIAIAARHSASRVEPASRGPKTRT